MRIGISSVLQTVPQGAGDAPQNSRVSLERNSVAGVKPAMRPVKAMLVALLPVMWLMASGHGAYDDGNQDIDLAARKRISAAIDGQHKIFHAASSSNLSARRINRRFGIQFGPDSSPNAETSYLSPLFGERCAGRRIPFSSAPPGLAETWQFKWRAALEPRAPSGIS